MMFIFICFHQHQIFFQCLTKAQVCYLKITWQLRFLIPTSIICTTYHFCGDRFKDWLGKETCHCLHRVKVVALVSGTMWPRQQRGRTWVTHYAKCAIKRKILCLGETPKEYLGPEEADKYEHHLKRRPLLHQLCTHFNLSFLSLVTLLFTKNFLQTLSLPLSRLLWYRLYGQRKTMLRSPKKKTGI